MNGFGFIPQDQADCLKMQIKNTEYMIEQRENEKHRVFVKTTKNTEYIFEKHMKTPKKVYVWTNKHEKHRVYLWKTS